MEKVEMKRLAAEVVRFIRPTPGCVTCGKCFGMIRHKLPLTEDQQTRIRYIEYEAKNQIHYIPKVESTFLIALTLILPLLSYVLLIGEFCQSINLFFLKRDLKYKRTIEDKDYY